MLKEQASTVMSRTPASTVMSKGQISIAMPKGRTSTAMLKEQASTVTRKGQTSTAMLKEQASTVTRKGQTSTAMLKEQASTVTRKGQTGTAIPKGRGRAATSKHHMPRAEKPKRLPRIAVCQQRARAWRRLYETVSRFIRTSPKRYSAAVPIEICLLCMTFTLRFHLLEASYGALAAMLFELARGTRTNCQWTFQ